MIRTLIALTFCLLTFQALAASVSLSPAHSTYALGPVIEILEDPAGNLSLEQVTSPTRAGDWRLNDQPVPHFVYSHSTYWLRLRFESTFDLMTSWWLELGFPLHDYVDYYVVDGNKLVTQVHTGDRLPFSTRMVDHEHFLFELNLPAQGKREVYLRFDTADGLHEPIPLKLWNKDAFALENSLNNQWLGAYFGIMLVMALYNLFIYVSVRDKTYLYYVGYIVFFSLWLFSYTGFSFRYFWPDRPDFYNQSIVIMTCLWSILMVQFVRAYLDTARHVPWFEIVAKSYLVAMFSTIVYSLFGDYAWSILSVILFGLLACIAGIGAGIATLRKGFRPARYYLLAWTALLVSIAVFCLKVAGILPTSWLIERGVQIGSMIEVILLSLGLADKINLLKKEKMQAQEDALQAYAAALQLKNDFLMTVSHELRTPMNAIVGGIDILRQNHQVEDQATLDIIDGGAANMIGLVNDILMQAEIQSGNVRVHTRPASLHELLLPVIQPFRNECDTKGIAFSCQFADSLPPCVQVDDDKIAIITTNLLRNAVAFTQQGRVNLTVDFHSNSGQLVISVSDTGPGIDVAQQQHVFEPFRQNESGFLRRHGGLGVGLSICHHLAQAMGGSLTLESQPGSGSTFTLRVPVSQATAPSATEANRPPASALPILIVEDNVVNQKILVKLVEKLGAKSLVANNGLEALALIEKHAVALVLMDLQMPDMDGFSCTKAIRKQSSPVASLPIIAVTANLMDADKQRCLDSGMNDYLQKPVTLAVLHEHLSRFLTLPDQSTT